MFWSREYLESKLVGLLTFAAKQPGEFLLYVVLILSPFLAISAFLSWKLSKAIEKEEKDKKRKSKMQANVAKARQRKSD